MSELYSSTSGSYETYLSERQVDQITTTIKEATDIQMMETEKMLMKDTVYDLQGRKVNRSTKKGVYVVNGKKLINRQDYEEDNNHTADDSHSKRIESSGH